MGGRVVYWEEKGVKKVYKICKTEQSARRQKQITEGLLELMEKHRYEDITVSDLCQSLAMPRKAFYRYFSSKDDALLAMLDLRLMEYGSGDPGRADAKILKFSLDLDWFFTFWQLQKPLLDALERSGIRGILVERAIRNSQDALIFELPEKSREYVNTAATFAVTGLMSMVLSWHQEGYRSSPAQMAQMARQLLKNPLIPE